MNMKPQTIRTPNNIDVLLHCHLRCEPHEREHAPAVQEALHMLESCGAIEPFDNYYVTTEKGKAWVAALCNVHEPRQVFVDQYDEPIKYN